MDAAALLRLHVDKVEKEGSLDADGSSLAETKAKIGMMLGKCIYHMNALYEGNTAKLTFFEPRVFACKPAECTGGYLMHLSMLVTRVVSASAGIALFTGRDFCFHNSTSHSAIHFASIDTFFYLISPYLIHLSSSLYGCSGSLPFHSKES